MKEQYDIVLKTFGNCCRCNRPIRDLGLGLLKLLMTHRWRCGKNSCWISWNLLWDKNYRSTN